MTTFENVPIKTIEQFSSVDKSASSEGFHMF